MFLELVRRYVEAFDQFGGRDDSLLFLSALVEQVREQRLQNRKALGHYGSGDALEVVPAARLRLRRQLAGSARVPVADEPQRPRHFAPELRRRGRRRAAILTQDPGCELAQVRVLGHEDAVLDATVLAVRPLDPPGRVVGDLDPRLAGEVADLPGRPVAVRLDLEFRRQPEVSLAARREADVAAD